MAMRLQQKSSDFWCTRVYQQSINKRSKRRNPEQKMNKKEEIDEAQQHTAERGNLKRESKFYVI